MNGERHILPGELMMKQTKYICNNCHNIINSYEFILATHPDCAVLVRACPFCNIVEDFSQIKEYYNGTCRL